VVVVEDGEVSEEAEEVNVVVIVKTIGETEVSVAAVDVVDLVIEGVVKEDVDVAVVEGTLVGSEIIVDLVMIMMIKEMIIVDLGEILVVILEVLVVVDLGAQQILVTPADLVVVVLEDLVETHLVMNEEIGEAEAVEEVEVEVVVLEVVVTDVKVRTTLCEIVQSLHQVI